MEENQPTKNALRGSAKTIATALLKVFAYIILSTVIALAICKFAVLAVSEILGITIESFFEMMPFVIITITLQFIIFKRIFLPKVKKGTAFLIFTGLGIGITAALLGIAIYAA